MTDENKAQSKQSDGVKMALIGAAATVLVAVISGVFSLMGQGSAPPPVPAPVETPSSLPPTDTPLPPTETPTSVPTPTDTPAPVGGLRFATQIGPDGRAVDPDTTFPVAAQDFYAVFRPGEVPPGVAVAVENPDPNAYYAFLRPATGSNLSTFGWRWYKNGEIVNEYEADATVVPFWLQRYAGSDGSVFSTLAGPGTYRIVILLDGNPSVSADVGVIDE